MNRCCRKSFFLQQIFQIVASYSALGKKAEYGDERVCLSVCLSVSLSAVWEEEVSSVQFVCCEQAFKGLLIKICS